MSEENEQPEEPFKESTRIKDTEEIRRSGLEGIEITYKEKSREFRKIHKGEDFP